MTQAISTGIAPAGRVKRRIGKGVLAALVAGATALMMSATFTPAEAHGKRHWDRGHYQKYHHRHYKRHHYRPAPRVYYAPGYHYAPPPVYYRPAPAYYPPAYYGSPSLNVVIPIR